jgi:flagellar motor switch protein FliM
MPDTTLQPLNLVSARVTSRNRLPGTDMLRERFFRMVRSKMFQVFRHSVQILDEASDIVPHDDYLNRSGQHLGIYVIYEMPPIRGFTIIHLSNSLTAAIVDDVFGARDLPSSINSNAEELSDMERRIGKRTTDIFSDAITEACAPHFQITPKWSRTELHTALASVADSSDPLFVISGVIAFPCGAGDMSIAIPHKGLEPFREALASPISGLTKLEDDTEWADQITASLDDVPIELAFQIGEIRTALANIAAMRVGDILPARIFNQARVVAQGSVVGLADYGSLGLDVGIAFQATTERGL